MLDWLFSDPLAVGTPAPDFRAFDDEGLPLSLAAFRGRPLVLVFYPGDDTPTCTKQLCEFRDRWDLVQARNAAVLGVNPWSRERHVKFRRKFSFPFPLLVDRDQQVARLYHADGIWTKRTVYLIDAAGIIRYARRGKPSPEEVLQALP